MRYVILGSSAAGINAGRTLRTLIPDKKAEIIMVSKDETIYSRCILHHYLGKIRTIKELNFAEHDYFEKFNIQFIGNTEVVGLDVDKKTLHLDTGETLEYDKLLIATGASSFVPPIPLLREATNMVGFRNIDDIECIKSHIQPGETEHSVIVVGAGLVGLDAVSGLLDVGVAPTLLDLAPYPLVKQLDEISAQPYVQAMESRGVRQIYSTSIDSVIYKEGTQDIETIKLSNGETLPCTLLIMAAGVRSNTGFLENTPVELKNNGLVIDTKGRTNIPDIYGAGDVSGLGPIWPIAVKEGIIAATNMVGRSLEMTDFFASKSTMNFWGITTLSLGNPNLEGDEYQIDVLYEPEEKIYKKIVHKDGKIYGAILQGDIDYSGILQQLILHKIDISRIRKSIFDIDYSDFFHINDKMEYLIEEPETC